MQELIREQTVFDEVAKALAETVRATPSTIRPETSVVRDLGAESLDFLDLNYRLEQAFGIRMARHFFLEHMEEMYGEGAAIDADGRLTPRAIGVLKARYPEAVLPEPEAGLDMDEVPSLITVRALVGTVTDILGTLPERCPCGATAWRTEDGTHVICGDCRHAAPYANGDDLTRRWLAGVLGAPARPPA